MEAPRYSADTVERIYRCASPDTAWEVALEAVREATQSRDAILRVARGGGRARHAMFAAGATSSPETIAMWERASPHDLPFTGGLKAGEGRIVTWRDHAVPLAALFERIDIGHTMMACVDLTNGLECVLHCNRASHAPAFGAGDLGTLQRLARLVGDVLRIRREIASGELVQRAHVDALNRIGIAIILVNSAREAKAINATAERVLTTGSLRIGPDKRLHAADAASDRRLQKSIEGAIASDGLYGRSLLLRGGDREIIDGTEHRAMDKDWLLHVAVSSWSIIADGFERPERCALVHVRGAATASPLDVASLRDMFGFTQAEARVAIGLMRVSGVRQLASELSVADATVRAHLRAIYAKAGVNSRFELASLIQNGLAPLASFELEHG